MAEIVDKAVLQDADYLRALKRIESGINRMTNQAEKEFAGVSKSASASGVQIGAVSGVVQALTQNFINLGQQAARAFVQFNKEAVGLASELETTGAVFEGIFQGNEAAAVAALERVRKESRGLGIDLQETARAFLPFVENLNQLSKVGEIAAALAISQPEQGALGARVALQEFLSGNAQSLVRRFEIPKNLGKELNEAIATGGVEEGLNKLEGILQRMGRTIDQLGDTFQLSLGRAQISAEQLQTAFGVPITAELKSQLDDLNEVVKANFDDFEGLATLAGNVIAEIAGAADLSGIAQFFADNKQEIAEFLTALQEIAKSAKEFADIDLSKGLNVNALTDAALKIDKIVNAINTIKTITESADTSSFTDGLTAGIEGIFPLYTAFIEIWENLDRVIIAVIGTYGLFIATATEGQAILNNAYQEFLAFTGQIEESQKKLIDPQKAYTDSVAETNKAIAEYKANVAEAATAVDNATIPTKESTEAGEDQADAFLEQAAAARELADAQEEAAAAQKKIDDAKAKALADYQRDILEADIKFERARTDTLLDFQRKREDAARQNLQKIADIEKKNKQEQADSELELDRDIEDINRKHSQEKIEQRKEEGQKILDLQVETSRKIADILKESQVDLDEAERTRDAVGFLRIIRKRNQDIASAQQEAARKTQDTQLEGQRRREQLKIQQEQERADAQLANERRLEDLQTSLDRELEQQAIAYDREREQIATNEQRKLDDLVTARERDKEDALRHYNEKLADLDKSLADELATVQRYNQLLEAEAARHAQAMAAAGQSSRTSSPRNQPEEDVPNSRPGFQNRQRQQQPTTRTGQQNQRRQRQTGGRRQFGGLVNAGGSYPVGENGPELFQPSGNGRIVPNSALVMPSMTPKSSISNVSNSKQQEINIPMVSGGALLDPIFVAQIRNMILSELGRVL